MSAFSMPPILCSRPGVPGIAQGRASVTGSRRNGSNSSASAPAGSAKANSWLRSGRLPVSGMRHGSEPLAR